MSQEFRHIVRIRGKDIDGSKRLAYGLSAVDGVDINLARALVKVSGLDPKARLGELSDSDLKAVEEVLLNPTDHGIPPWMVNRHRDPRTGRDLHMTGADLELQTRSDIDSMKDIRSWKGVRHALGLKVRGQHTKTTGRSALAVGVKKKALVLPEGARR